MEFKLKNQNSFVQAIEFNYEDLRHWITDQVEQYKNLVYTDDTIKDAKEDRAKLNKFRESIDNARKDVKKTYLAPYNAFEEKVKSLLALIEEPAKAIDIQVKAYEQAKKDNKRAEIEAYYNATAGDLLSLLPLEKIFDSKWLNSTVNIKSVQSEIDKIVAKANFDIQTIKDLKSEWQLTLIDTYLNTLDIGRALAEKTRLEARKQELENNQVTEVNKMVETPEPEPKEEAKIYIRKFWVKGTADQLRALGQYMKNNGIEYGGIE